MIRLTRPASDLAVARKQEWLETNGLGGFASSTITGMNTRRYHGLLTAATHPPVGRMVLLSRMEETLMADGKGFELSCNQYPGVVHPDGYQYLAEFRLDPFPVFTYQLPTFSLIKRVFMIRGENATVIEYELVADRGAALPERCSLEIRPLLAFRDYHSLTHQNNGCNGGVDTTPGHATVALYPDLPALHFAHSSANLQITGDWYHNFEYLIEQERGLDFQEDLFNPFALTFDLRTSPSVAIIASLESHDFVEVPRLRENELARRRGIQSRVSNGDDFITQLTEAADQFVVKRANFESVIAGYHWFTDWGRDTMISLPGLTLVTGRFQEARDILRAFAGVVDQGMLPNRFTDGDEKPEYNTVDATLWCFEAIAALLRYTKDYSFVQQYLFPKLAEIFEWHVRGTRYGICANKFGLLECGETGVQLTWMDAKVGDFVVTPRYGMPVEIQALWYNALRILAELAPRFGEPTLGSMATQIADHAKENFNRLFWNESKRCLFDVVNRETKEGSIRPNQIFAASLTHPILDDRFLVDMVTTVEHHLLTPRGLRSLSPEDPNYRGVYEGDSWQRDTAYHQGTVWSWLLGPFAKAYLRAYPNSKQAQAKAKQVIYAMQDHFIEAGLGQVSEIFDGNAPHHPRGCIAQAWGVAELLRAAVEMGSVEEVPAHLERSDYVQRTVGGEI